MSASQWFWVMCGIRLCRGLASSQEEQGGSSAQQDGSHDHVNLSARAAGAGKNRSLDILYSDDPVRGMALTVYREGNGLSGEIISRRSLGLQEIIITRKKYCVRRSKS